MQIANPIYDVVFKYLMDDNRIAKLIISKIIDEEIEELQFLSTEDRSDFQERNLIVYRLDFSAKIKTGTGELKQVIIEIQKAKFPTDIMRFRKYLGLQYLDKNNTFYEGKKKKAYPIISIYFLGHKLENTDVPIIRVNRNYIDVATGKHIERKEEFIESLTHDSHIIQIPYLTNRRRNELEILLSVFDQSIKTRDQHILNIQENEFPEAYSEVIRRLQRAIAEPVVRKRMDLEDEILEELDNLDRQILEGKLENAKNKKIISEKEQVILEKDKALTEMEKRIAEMEKLLKDQSNTNKK